MRTKRGRRRRAVTTERATPAGIMKNDVGRSEEELGAADPHTHEQQPSQFSPPLCTEHEHPLALIPLPKKDPFQSWKKKKAVGRREVKIPFG